MPKHRVTMAVAFAAVVVSACGRVKPAIVAGEPDGAPEASHGDASAVDVAAQDERDGRDENAESGERDANAVDASLEGPGEAGSDAAEAGVDSGDLPGSPYRALAISTGHAHTCALLDDHSVKCWGDNWFGELGTGDARSRLGGSASDMGNALPKVDLGTGRTARAIAAGGYVTCALLDDRSVKCWGYSALTGQPSLGNLGDAPDEMGDHLAALDFGAGRKATHLAAGFYYSCAELDDGTESCWGAAMPPMAMSLGSAARVRQLSPGSGGVLTLFEDGTVTASPPGTQLGLVSGATYVAGSLFFSLAIGAGGAVEVLWGSNGNPPRVTSGAVAVGTGDTSFSCVLLEGGAVKCWGGPRGCNEPIRGLSYWCTWPPDADGGARVLLGQPAVALSTGGNTTMCAILADGGVKCWGASEDCNQNGVCAPSVVQDDTLGSSLDITTNVDGKHGYGAWRSVDLGTRP